jgi:exodeoxyribonuclease V alpha subunit
LDKILAPPTVRITGEVHHVRYENPDTGFAVLVMTAPNGEKFVACGVLAGSTPGKTLELSGHYEDHAEFGREFNAESAREVLPRTADGIVRFLCGAVPGIGPKTADLIVKHFGDDTLNILDKSPRRLIEVPGIGPRRAADLAAAWKQQGDRRDQLIFLQGLGVTPAYCRRLFKRYGENASEVVRENPYRLAEEVDGIGFLKADGIARELGIAEDSPDRLAAAATFALNEATATGSVCLPAGELAERTATLLKRVPADGERAVKLALERNLVREDGGMIYTPQLLRFEIGLPLVLKELATCAKFSGRRLVPRREGASRFAPEQLQALENAGRYPLNIITGGPGVGKTTVVGELVGRAKAAKLRVVLAAPTGRAAKRLSESAAGEGAKTIHRLLGFDPATGRFGYDREHRLKCDLLIVDEASMLDLPLAWALFSAVPRGASVVLVGDVDQLPSVGPGRVLADLIKSGLFGVTFLTRVFRQAEHSRIIVNAHLVNRGELPESSRDGGDFYWIEQKDPLRVQEIIRELVTSRISGRFGIAPADTQVLTPMNRGACGALALNELLGGVLNPEPRPELKIGERTLKVGDRVMQLANDYDKNVFNGDMGVMIRLSSEKRKFVVRFDGSRDVEYAFDEADQLTRAYAITIHKSQGSEFPAVIVPLLNQHFVMLRRNLLYTAMTRARKLLVLIGDRQAVEMAVRNTRVEVRWSRLLDRLRQARLELDKSRK